MFSYTKSVSDANTSIELATQLQSPFATNYHYYSTQEDAYTNSGAGLSKYSDAAGTDIYVGYDFDDTKGIKLDGSETYILKFNANWYLSLNGTNTANRTSNVDVIIDKYEWTLYNEHNDPYDITLRNANLDGYFLCFSTEFASNTSVMFEQDANPDGKTIKTFAYLKTNDGQMRMVGFSDYTTSNKNKYGYFNSNNQWENFSDINSASMNGGIADIIRPIKYHLISNPSTGSREVFWCKKGQHTGDPLSLPNTFKSPVLQDEDYLFYTSLGDATNNIVANAVNTLADGVTDIYVRYVYNRSSASIKLDGSANYSFLQGTDATKNAFLKATTGGSRCSEAFSGEDDMLWYFHNEDPYAITIRSVAFGDSYFLAIGDGDNPPTGWTNCKMFNTEKSMGYFSLLANNHLVSFKTVDGEQKFCYWGDSNSNNYWCNGSTLISDYSASGWGSAQSWIIRNAFPITLTERIPKVSATFKVVTIDKDGTGGKVALIVTNTGYPDDALELPSAHQSPLVKSGSYRYYTEDQFVVSDDGSRYKLKDGAVASTVYPATSGQVFYVTYEYDPDNEESIKLDGSTWYSFKDNYTSGYYLYSSKTLTYGYYDVSHAASIPNSENDAYYWKFTGEDPYNIIIYNSAIQGYHLTASTTGDGDNRPRLSRDGFTEGYPETWIYLNNSRLVTGPNANNKHFHLFGNFYLGSSLASSINDAARVTLSTPTEKTYTFHIIDRSGHKAIKATGKWPIGVTLNYNAIPKEIRSPYIADETLTFYSQTASETAHTSDTNDRRSTYTFSDGDKLEESPASGDDIYVTYTIDKLSEKQLDFSGTRQYYIQAYDDKFVTKLDLAGGAGWSANYYLGSLLTAEQIAYHGNNDNAFWRLIGNDPYNVRIKGHAFWWFSQNDKGYVLRFQNVDNNYPNIGVIPMPDADDVSTFKLLCARHDTDDRWYFRRQTGSSTDVADWIYTGTTNDEQCNFRFYPVIHYRVFNQSGTEAIDWRGPSTFTADGSQITVSLPAGVRSPLIPAEDFTLHTISKDGEAITAPISRSISDVFVTYTTANIASNVNLVGGSHYNIKQPANSEGSSYYYWYRYADDHGRINVNNATTTANKKENKYCWELLGNDPYAVEIRNWENTDYQVTANFGNAHGEIYSDQTVRKWTRFLLLGQQGEADNSGKYRMMVSMTRENELNMNSYDWTLSWRKESSTPDGILHPNNFYIPYQTIVEFESDLTYHVINLSGKEAIVYEPESEDVSKTKVLLPDQFKSPLAKEYKYYPPSQMNYDSSTGVFSAKEGATPLSENSDVNSDVIFVTYEYNAEAGVDLSGATSYGMFINGADEKGYRMLGFSPRYQSRTNLPVYTQPLEPRKHYSWYLNGGAYNDPYDVTFKNEYSNRYQYINDKNDNLLTEPNSSSSATHFMILAGSSTDRYEVAYMKNNVLRRLYYYGSSSDNGIYSGTGCKEEKAHETDICQIAFTPLYIFHVINFDGKKVISAPGDLVKGENTTLELPHVISSPLIDHYYYYNATDVTNSEDVYTLNTNATNITTLNQVSGQDIYVFYRQADINENLDLTGQVAYNLKANGYYSFYNAGNDYVCHTSTPEDATADDYLWMITGNDPYNIQFYNVKQGMSVPLTMNSNYTHGGDARLVSVKSLGSNTAANSFIITRGLENHYEVLLAYTSGTSYPSPLSADYFHYLAKQTNDNPTITHNENIYHLTGDNYTIFDFVPARNNTLTYIVVNKRGTKAMKAVVDAALDVEPALPPALKSPMAKNFTYHSTQNNATDNIVTKTVAGQTIYVYYDIDTDKVAESNLLNGSKFFYMKANATHYAYVNDEAAHNALSNTTKVEESATGGHNYAWALEAPNGGDPYDITVRAPLYPSLSLGTPQYNRPANAPRHAPADNQYDLQLYDDKSGNSMRFALLQGNSMDGHYALVAARGEDVAAAIYGDQLDYIGCQDDGTLKLLQSNIDNVDDATQLEFEDYELQQQYKYHIVSLQDKKTILEVAETEDGITIGGMAVNYMPDALKRKGVKYAYISESATDVAKNGIDPSSVYAIGNALFQLGFQQNIYVGYEIDEESLGFKYSGTLAELSSLTDDDLEDLNWNLWQVDYSTDRYNKRYFYSQGDGNVLGRSDKLTTQPTDNNAYLWAFFGDPYRTKIINKATGKSAFLAVSTNKPGNNPNPGEANIYVSSDETNFAYNNWGYSLHTENGTSETYQGQFFLNNVTYGGKRYYIDARGWERAITGLGDQEYVIIPLINWTYHVINLSGRQAITAKARGIGTGYTASLPDIVKACFAENYTYYNDANTTVTNGVRTFTGSNQISFTNTIDGEDIYVKYTVTDKWKTVAEIPGHGNLNGTTYTMTMQMSNYVGYDESRTPMVQADGSSTNSRNGNWIIKANHTESGYDPYDITIASFARPDHLVAIGTYGENMTFTDDESQVQKFILYNTTDANPYRFLAANSASESGNTYAYLRCGSEHGVYISRDKTATDAETAVNLYHNTPTYIYHIYNLSNEEAIRLNATGISNTQSTTLEVPKAIRSQLIDTWHFYSDASRTTPLTSIENLPFNSHVYIDYDYVNNTRGLIDLGGETFYNINFVEDERYWLPNGSNIVKTYTTSADKINGTTDYNDDSALWRIVGSDPYGIVFENASLNNYVSDRAIDATYYNRRYRVNMSNTKTASSTAKYSLVMSEADGNDFELIVNRPCDGGDNVLSLEINAEGRVTYKAFNNSNTIFFGYGSDKPTSSQAQIHFTPRSIDYAYHIINRSGEKALMYKGKGVQGKAAKELPRSIQSPLASEMRFYLEADVTVVETDGVKHYTEPDESKRQITFPEPEIDPETLLPITPHLYAFYDFDNTQHPTVNLSSRRYYYLKAGLDTDLRYIGTDGSEVLATTDKVKPTSTETSTYLWMLDSNDDPYNLKLHTVSASTSLLGSDNYDEGQQETNYLGSSETTVGTFCLLPGNGNDTEYYTLVAASADGITDNQYAYLGLEDGALKLLRGEEYTNSKAALQMQLEIPQFNYTYRVVNLSDQVAIQLTEEQMTGEMPHLPTAIASPFATPTGYYDEKQFTVTGTGASATYILNSMEQSMDAEGSMGLPYYDATIYVLYEFNGKKDFDLSGHKYYYLLVGEDADVDQATGTPASDKYQHLSGSTLTSKSRPATVTDNYLWALDGGSNTDPYSLTLRNRSNSSANAYGKKFIMVSNGDDGQYQLMESTGIGTTNLMYLQPATTITATDKQRVQLLGVPVPVTYYIVNLNNTVATHHTVTSFAGDFPSLPALIKSPLVEQSGGSFSYYTGTTLKSSSKVIESIGTKCNENEYYIPYSSASLNVYVTYTYDNSNSAIDLSGRGKFHIINGSHYLRNTKNGDRNDLQWRSKTEVLNDLENPAEDSEEALLNGFEPILWELIPANNDTPDPYAVVIRRRNGWKLHYQSGYSSTSQVANGAWQLMTYGDGKNGASSYQFAMLGGENNMFRFMAVAYNNNYYDEFVNEGQVYQFLEKNLGDPQKVNVEPHANQSDVGIIHKLEPADIIDVVYHLTTHIGKKEMTLRIDGIPVNMEITVPEVMRRNYVKYKNPDTGEVGKYKVTYYPIGSTELTEASVNRYPLADTEDNKPMHVYFDYETSDLPFNLLTTANGIPNTKEAIESLDFDQVFDLSTYEKRAEKAFPAGNEDNPNGYLYFLVQNVDNTFNKGQQYFLQRDRETGHIAYLSSRGKNDYDLHPSRSQNANEWKYSHVAEYYRATDHDAFREKSWLWAFAGDPYDLYLFNLEGVTQEVMDPVTENVSITRNPRHAVTWQTLTKTTSSTTTKEHVVRTPDYTTEDDLDFKGTRWALGFPGGSNSDQTFSLMAGETDEDGNFLPDGTSTQKPRYWQISHSAMDGIDEVLLMEPEDISNLLDFNLQVLPYEPMKYEDVNLVIRREDNIGWDTPGNLTANTHKDTDLQPQTTGLSELFYSAKTREFAEGDKISNQVESLPYDARRQFCDYTIYTDVYDVAGPYTVKAGPYRDNYGHIFRSATATDTTYVHKDDITQTTTDWKLAYVHTGETAVSGVWPQNVYVKYTVNSDIFLRKHPTKAEVAKMVENNDHVYFMDFTDNKSARGYTNAGHHAYFDDISMFEPDMQTELEKDGEGKPVVTIVKDKDGNDVKTVTTTATGKKNTRHYYTTTNRMETTPNALKWYFVGDPYEVQLYNVNGEWNDEGTVQANLARFDPTESRYQYVVDCVHLRLPDLTIVDPREYLLFYESGLNTGGMTTGEVVRNPNYNKPFYDNFTWQVVPSISGKPDEFALRFKRDNVQLNYRNVYYYLAHDGKSKTYKDGTTYKVNLSYEAENDRHLTGSYKGMHAANDASCVIRVTPPVKVYFSAYKEEAEDNAHASANLKVRDELSEYFGLGETINEVPRHLQRKFVKYSDLTYKDNTVSHADHAAAFPFLLSSDKVYESKPCKDNTAEEGQLGHTVAANGVFVNGTLNRVAFKFSVDYQVDDITEGNFHLFTTQAEYDADKPQWLDVKVGGSKWLYFDKILNADNTSTVSGYNAASGWTTGIKGLHWAFVGDPYDFTIVNRRRYEDDNKTGNQWLAAVKETIQNFNSTATDSVVWYTRLQTTNTMADASSTATAALTDGSVNTRFSLGLWKTGDANSFYLRTASLKQTTGDNQDGSTSTNETNNFWRLVNVDYTSQDGSGQKTAFVAVPYSLADRNFNTTTDATMNNLHTSQQPTSIGTAVAKDNDRVGGTYVNNDCFDANVTVYKKGDPTGKASILGVELRYGEVVSSMPVSLKRWGCDYKCYLNYDPATGTGTEIREFRESVDPVNGYNNERDLLQDLIASGEANISYVYTVTDEAALFFTAASDARLEEFTWVNPYYQWDYRGTGEPTWIPVPKFDGYTYNADGHITGEIWHTEYEWSYPAAGSTITAYGWLNTHSSNDWTYGNEMRQGDDDRLKWSLVGDPYSFTMTNYAQYLLNPKSALTYKSETIGGQNVNVVQATSSGAQTWAISVDANGNPYLAAIDNNGNVTAYVSFDRFDGTGKTLDASAQYLKLTGNGRNTSDPTGNLLSTGGAKAFFLSGLLRYAALVQYHLVMAHQHSLDFEEKDQVGKTAINNAVNEHLKEYLKYKATNTYYDDATENGVKPSTEDQVRDMLRQDGTLRDFVSFPVEDYSVSRVGIGTRPQVPWYMKRQFCEYTVYQRDVLSSLTLNGQNYYPMTINGVNVDYPRVLAYKKDDNGNYLDANGNVTTDPSKYVQLWMDDAHTQPAYEIAWVSVTNPAFWSDWTTSDEADRKMEYPTGSGKFKKKPRGYDRIVEMNGKQLLRFDSLQHYNRKVIADVTYRVKTTDFRFADQGRSTTAWYQMMTNNERDGLMNFSYRNGVGARLDRQHHYTNNYLWAPEGDPYGFVLRSRYATINGTGWDDVAVSTKGALPKKGEDFSETPDVPGELPMYQATYTGRSNSHSSVPFHKSRIVHLRAGEEDATTDGATNAIYEMFTGNVNEKSFLMHPVSAWIDANDATFDSYYMVHDTEHYRTYLRRMKAADVQGDVDANWRLTSTADQLWPYFERAGYVGGLQPVIANRYSNRVLKSTLENYIKNPSMVQQNSVLDEARRLVYSGHFYEVDNTGNVVTTGHQGDNGSVSFNESRPANRMRFVSDNLVNMQRGYYRIQAFSQQALSNDGKDLSGLKAQGIAADAIQGIVGPRYISGYRFQSERVDNPNAPSAGGRWLHLISTKEDSTTIQTWGELKDIIKDVDEKIQNSSLPTAKKAALENRDIFDHQAMRGNIEILPVEYDPSSIFYLNPVTNDRFDRISISTQGLELQARPGGSQLTPGTIDPACGHTMLGQTSELKTGYSNRFRLDDVGGTAITLRTFNTEVGIWDDLVEQNIKTNYLCIDSLHRYRVTIHTDNEMKEIGDHTDEHGINGVQDTKWLLQPVGMPGAEWPYQAPMPLRLEVQKGGKTASGTDDDNYYGSLYTPFDTRLNSTVDVAFTVLGEPNVTDKTLRMGSVSTINNMGNPQFVPASWPVVVRTAHPKTGFTGRKYVELYLPNSKPTVIADNGINANLRGQYLEQQLTDGTTDGSVMVFGLPFKNHNVAHDDASHHDYDRTDSEYGRVGFYKNDNWWRDYLEGDITSGQPTTNDGNAHSAFLATDANATDNQRNNLYVYHNKVYYVYTGSSPAPQVLNVVFGDDNEEEDQNIQDEVKKNVPWPCDVYDLQGRKVASDETPQTLLKNHPTLLKGVYIFGGRKVIVK